MQSTHSESDFDRSLERISEALSEIHYPDYSAFRLLLNEFTQLIARHYDFFDHEILKNVSHIEINLKYCKEEKEISKSTQCWEKAILEFTNALSMVKKETAVE